MKFLMTFDWTPDEEDRAEAIARFQNTGGTPHEGITLLGRWTRADLSGGLALLETDDPGKLAAFAYEWNNIMELDIIPVLDDQELFNVMETVSR